MAQQPARRKMQSSKTTVSIPDKLYFRIGDVSSLCSLPAYVLRFWETEFPQLKPNKGGTGQRLYRKRDVEIVLEIKRLLYEDGFTIAGARRSLAEKKTTLVAHNRRAGDRPTQDRGDDRGEDRLRPVPETARKGKKQLGSTSVAAAAASQGVKSDRGGQRISELRNEMREILSLLGSQPELRPALQTTKRGGKKNPAADEPTLF